MTDVPFGLADIPTSLDEGGLPADAMAWLNSIPTSIDEEGLIDYPASDPDGGSEPLTVRIPRSWIDMIDSIRQKPGTKTPDLWPKRGNFVRWCIFGGIREMRILQLKIDSGAQLDPTLQARIFVEKQGGHIAARAQIMNDATSRADEIGEAVSQLMLMEEYTEAADLINQWVTEATKNDSPSWQRFFCRVLLLNEKCAAAVKTLVADSYITDEFFIGLARVAHVLDMEPPYQPIEQQE